MCPILLSLMTILAFIQQWFIEQTLPCIQKFTLILKGNFCALCYFMFRVCFKSPFASSVFLPLYNFEGPYNPSFHLLHVLCLWQHLLVGVPILCRNTEIWCWDTIAEGSVSQLLVRSLSFCFFSFGPAFAISCSPTSFHKQESLTP